MKKDVIFRGKPLTSFRSVRVYEEIDYSKFKKLPFNRDLNHVRIAKIAKDINGDFDFRFEKPIDVIIRKLDGDNKEYYYIVDGQHRFNACKLVNKSIFFIVHTRLSEEHILKINENMASVNMRDVINYHALFSKIKAYSLLKDAVKETGFKERTLLKMSGQTSSIKGLASGKLKYSMDNFAKAKQIQKVFKILKLKDKGAQERYLPIAIDKFIRLQKIDITTLIKRVRKNINSFDSKKIESEGTAYVHLINNLWNKGLPLNSDLRVKLEIDFRGGKILIPKIKLPK